MKESILSVAVAIISSIIVIKMNKYEYKKRMKKINKYEHITRIIKQANKDE